MTRSLLRPTLARYFAVSCALGGVLTATLGGCRPNAQTANQSAAGSAQTPRVIAPIYAKKLGLKPLPTPQTLTPFDEAKFEREVSDAKMREIIAAIEKAATVKEAQTALENASEVAELFIALSPDVPPSEKPMQDEAVRALRHLKYAAQIKCAQMKAADAADSSGEVKAHLRDTKQCLMNADALQAKVKK